MERGESVKQKVMGRMLKETDKKAMRGIRTESQKMRGRE